MGRSKKRVKSGDSDNGGQRKADKYGGSPGVTGPMTSVSEILSETNSVLYSQDAMMNTTHNAESITTGTSTVAGDCHSPYSNYSLSTDTRTNATSIEPMNSEIVLYLKKIVSKVGDMDEKLKRLEIMEKKVDNVESEMKKLWSYIHDCDKKMEERINKVEDKSESIDFSMGLVNDKVVQLEKERNSLKDDVVYLQSQSMRKNLMFSNITEGQNEVSEETENKLRLFVKEKMKIAQELIDKMAFERVHRMGQKVGGYSRKIVARFTLFKEREMVRRQWKTLQGTEYYVNEQFPKEVNDKRRKLLPKLKEAKQRGQPAWLAYDTLYVNGKRITADEV
jgi:hypothetical protein